MNRLIACLDLLVLNIPQTTNIIMMSESLFTYSNARDNIKFELHLELARNGVGVPKLRCHFSIFQQLSF